MEIIAVVTLQQTDNQIKIFSNHGGKVKELYFSNDDFVEEGTPIMSIIKCPHPGLYGGLCISCGERADDKMRSKNTDITSLITASSASDWKTLTVSGGFTLQLSRTE
jgi:hypothetical protein